MRDAIGSLQQFQIDLSSYPLGFNSLLSLFSLSKTLHKTRHKPGIERS
ncbi:hypothetical protein AOR13_211 [Alteromonas stellipolaris LMG 21856]|nr:hypothetical protein AOR13_211 [Alteromonas stellipolaris LMG 21856]